MNAGFEPPAFQFKVTLANTMVSRVRIVTSQGVTNLVLGSLVDVSLDVDGDGRGALVQKSELRPVVEDPGHAHPLLLATWQEKGSLTHSTE